MKRIVIFLIGLCLLSSAKAQFPGTDSLRNYNNKYVTNNPATAFTNLRLNTLLRGIIDFIDTARAGTGGGVALGIDTLWALNDSTIRYRKNGVFRNTVLRGVYDTRRKVDTAYALNDSTLQIKINGTNRNIILPGRHWDLQGILNNGSTLTENEVITLADSLTFTSGMVVISTLNLPSLTNQVDTTTYKPVVTDAAGNVHKMVGWAATPSIDTTNKWINDIRRSNDSVYAFKNGSWQFKYIDSTGGGSGISGLTAGRITLSTSATTIGDDAGLTYDATTNTIISDTNRLKRINITGDSTFGAKIVFYPSKTKAGSKVASIGYGEANNEHDLDTSVNNTLEGKIGNIDGTGEYIRWGMEKRWMPYPGAGFYQFESHPIEVKYPDTNLVVRPISWTGAETGFDGTMLLKSNAYLFDNWNGQRNLAAINNAGGFWYGWNDNGSGSITLAIRDTTTAASFPLLAGAMITGQISGGVRLATWDYIGQQINANVPNGISWNSSAVGANSNVNYDFGITSGNTGQILKIGKSGQNHAFQILNNAHTILNRPDQNDDGSQFQVYSTTNTAITARQDNSGTNDVTYPLDIDRFTSGTVAAGFGMGIRFRTQTSNAAGFPYIGDITYRYTDPTQGTEDADFVVSPIRAGSLTEGFRVLSTGAAKFNNAFTFPTADGTSGQVLQTDGSGTVTWQTPSAGTTYTFSNGLTEASGTVKLGGTLIENTTINTGGFTTTWSGANDSETSFSVTNTGTTAASAIAGNVTGSTGAGVTGTSTTGNGVVGSSSSNYGVVGTSSTTAAFRGQINVASTDAIENIVSLLRTSSAGAGANGLGAAIQFELETATSGTSQTAGRLAFSWSDATNATRTSVAEIYAVNSGTTARKAALAGNGQWTWDGYGAGTHTVTPATTPVMSSSGVVGERIAPKIYTALLTATAGNAPTATVLGTNEIGSIVWTRVADGNYTGTLSSAFTANKTWALVQRGDMSGNFVNNWISSGSTSTVTLTVSDNLGNPVGDFTNMSIEIRVYP